MCGIAGLLHDDPDRAAAADAAARMGAALAHRGPDDAGLWHDGPVALAHRRLSVIDLSPLGRQPMASACGRHVVAYNGEIYNFPALRQALEGLGDTFRGRGDTEVLVAALARWGEAALDRLVGMFAFAWYDRAEKRLVLARDRLGIKPVYYTHQGGVFAFASEPGALRAGGFLSGGLDPAALDAYFAHLYVPAPETAHRGVFQLCPGEVVTVRRGRLDRRRWWTLARRIDPAWTLDSAAARYLDLLEDSVRLRRISDVPVGAFLSGGLDSGTVAAVMAAQGGAVNTFSVGFDDAQMDELRYARLAAEHLGTEHHEEMLRPDMVDLLPRITRHFGDPFADSSALPTWLVSRMARTRVTVALTGDGGDELFGGYAWTRAAAAVARYRQIPLPLRRLASPVFDALPRGARADKFRRFHADSFLPPVEAYRRRHTCLDAATRGALLAPCGGPVSARDRFLAHWEAAGDAGEGDRMLHVDTAMYLPDDVLAKVDRMSMAHGLEARVPLLDHRLVEFAATVPFHLKLARGVTKRLAKRAARALLPPALLRQRKQGFSVPIHRWFREELRGHFQDAVFAADARTAGLLDPRVARALFEAHQARRADLGHALWAILVLEHTLRAAD